MVYWYVGLDVEEVLDVVVVLVDRCVDLLRAVVRTRSATMCFDVDGIRVLAVDTSWLLGWVDGIVGTFWIV